MSRPKPFPDISEKQNRSVMDVHLNNYDIVYVKPLEDKLASIKPVYFITKDGSEAPVEKITVTDYSRVTYNDATKTLNFNLNVTGVTAFTDLVGVPTRFPNATEMGTKHPETGATSTTMFLVAREDGVYFENHVTGVEVEPRRSRTRSRQESRMDALERRIKELESQLK